MNGIEFLKDVDQQMLWAHMMSLVAVTSSGRFAYVHYVQQWINTIMVCLYALCHIVYVAHLHTVWTIQYGQYYMVVWWVHILQTFISYQGPRETNERATFLADREASAYSNPWSSQWPSTNTQVELIDTCNDSTNITNKRDSLIRKESVEVLSNNLNNSLLENEMIQRLLEFTVCYVEISSLLRNWAWFRSMGNGNFHGSSRNNCCWYSKVNSLVFMTRFLSHVDISL